MVSVVFNRGTSRLFLLAASLFCFISPVLAQKNNPNNAPVTVVTDTVTKNNLVLPQNLDTGKNAGGQYLTLKQCIDYAMQHQPSLNISLINADVTKETNAIALSGWLPQATASGQLYSLP